MIKSCTKIQQLSWMMFPLNNVQVQFDIQLLRRTTGCMAAKTKQWKSQPCHMCKEAADQSAAS